MLNRFHLQMPVHVLTLTLILSACSTEDQYPDADEGWVAQADAFMDEAWPVDTRT